MIAPSIDAFSPKNQALSPPTVAAILAAAGVRAEGLSEARPAVTRMDGGPPRSADGPT
jgi:hypothetical protein